MSGLRSSVDWGRASQGEGSPWSSVGPAHIISSPGGFLGSAGMKAEDFLQKVTGSHWGLQPLMF